MRHALIILVLVVALSGAAWANSVNALDRPLREHLAMFVMTLLGGIASFAMSVRKGEATAGMLMAAVGSMAASMVSGFGAYFACVEWLGLAGGLASGAAGLAGYMGGRALEWAEKTVLDRASKVLKG